MINFLKIQETEEDLEEVKSQKKQMRMRMRMRMKKKKKGELMPSLTTFLTSYSLL